MYVGMHVWTNFSDNTKGTNVHGVSLAISAAITGQPVPKHLSGYIPED